MIGSIASDKDLAGILKKSGIALLDKNSVKLISDNYAEIDSAISKVSSHILNITKFNTYSSVETDELIDSKSHSDGNKSGQNYSASITAIHALEGTLEELTGALAKRDDTHREILGSLKNMFAGEGAAAEGGEVAGAVGGRGMLIAGGLAATAGASAVAWHYMSNDAKNNTKTAAAIGMGALGVVAAPDLAINKLVGLATGDAVSSKPSATNSDANSYSNKFGKWLTSTITTVDDFVEKHPIISAMIDPVGAGVRAGQDFFSGAKDAWNGQAAAGSSANAEKAMNFFQSQGWSKNQSAGIVGNLQQESGKNLNPNARNSIGMYGIAQWDTTRRATFQRNNGKPIYGSSFDDQLKFIQWELGHTHKTAGNKLKQATTASEASAAVIKYYEGAQGQDDNKRANNANSLAGNQSFFSKAGNVLGEVGSSARDGVWSASKDVAQEIGHVAGNIAEFVTMGSNVNLAGVKPAMLERFKGMASDYHKQTGKKIGINSAYRSYQDQARLFAQYGPGRAARPGTSRHEVGLAIDLNSTNGNELEMMGLLRKWGFHRPYNPREPWHIEPIEGAKLAPLSATAELSRSGKPLIVANGGQAVTVAGHKAKAVPAPPRMVATSASNAIDKKRRAGHIASVATGASKASKAATAATTRKPPERGSAAKTSTKHWYSWYWSGTSR